MVPGLTTWRIDQARKHSAVVGEGVYEEREPVVRYRLDGEKVSRRQSCNYERSSRRQRVQFNPVL